MHQYVKRAAFLIYCSVDGLVYVDAIVLLKMSCRESLNAISERLSFSFFSTPAENCSELAQRRYFEIVSLFSKSTLQTHIEIIPK